jgi:hypothetical protein
VNITDDDNHLECISKLGPAIDKPYFMEIIDCWDDGARKELVPS